MEQQIGAGWECLQVSLLHASALAYSQEDGCLPRVNVPRSMNWKLLISSGLELDTDTVKLPILSVKTVTELTQ
jgi:hypothetical protein